MNKLIIADSFNNADMFYHTRVLVPDPFISVTIKSKSYILANSLEFSRIKKEASKEISVIPLEKYIGRAREKFKDITLATLAYTFLKEKKISSICIPATFPTLYSDFLRKQKLKVTILNPLTKQRVLKTPWEVKQIQGVQKIAEKAFNQAVKIIKQSKVRNSFLYHKGKKLTSQTLKQEISSIFSYHGLESPEDLIVSSGLDTAYPHKTGSGPIKSGSPIILDIFPRSQKSRYFTDMTRTICKGKPKNPKIQELFDLVLQAQNAGFAQIKPGKSAEKAHKAVLNTFKQHNMDKYFIHSTGHGVGIDIHEFPGIPSKTLLKEGMVITNEPGLYVPGVGGVRLEDIILVTKSGYRNLTKLPKHLVI
jgi:Xaa-Pro aminopeptidase